MSELKPCIPLPLDESVLHDVVEKAKDWALMHGAAMRSKAEFSPDALQVRTVCHCIPWYAISMTFDSHFSLLRSF